MIVEKDFINVYPQQSTNKQFSVIIPYTKAHVYSFIYLKRLSGNVSFNETLFSVKSEQITTGLMSPLQLQSSSIGNILSEYTIIDTDIIAGLEVSFYYDYIISSGSAIISIIGHDASHWTSVPFTIHVALNIVAMRG